MKYFLVLVFFVGLLEPCFAQQNNEEPDEGDIICTDGHVLFVQNPSFESNIISKYCSQDQKFTILSDSILTETRNDFITITKKGKYFQDEQSDITFLAGTNVLVLQDGTGKIFLYSKNHRMLVRNSNSTNYSYPIVRSNLFPSKGKDLFFVISGKKIFTDEAGARRYADRNFTLAPYALVRRTNVNKHTGYDSLTQVACAGPTNTCNTRIMNSNRIFWISRNYLSEIRYEKFNKNVIYGLVSRINWIIYKDHGDKFIRDWKSISGLNISADIFSRIGMSYASSNEESSRVEFDENVDLVLLWFETVNYHDDKIINTVPRIERLDIVFTQRRDNRFGEVNRMKYYLSNDGDLLFKVRQDLRYEDTFRNYTILSNLGNVYPDERKFIFALFSFPEEILSGQK